ncbi:MAG: polysaccharide biosynthesis tyrosine autokinase [Nitrospinae bacterium]|nr:polysaccharide biosynthesis tyrosine autokinase [Nitrospinota bacterium]
MAKKYELDIRDYVRILRKRRAIVIFTTLMLGIFSFVFATLQKPVPLYKASSSVKIEKSSTMAGLYLESISYSEYDTLETQATIIRSYPIMEIVAKRLGLLDEKLSSDEIRKNNRYLDVVLNLKEQVSTAQEGNTNIINITVTSDDPEFCQITANTIATIFKEQNTYEKNKRAISARRFIEDQLKVISTRLKEAEEKVKSFREENKLVSLSDQSRIVLDQLTRAEAQYTELTKSLSEMELMVSQLKEQKAIPKETLEGIVAERVGPIFQKLNTQLLDLNIKKESLLLIFMPIHPEVQDVNEQIANVTKNMMSQLVAQKNTMQRSVDSLKIEIEKLRAQLKSLPESGLQLARRERDVKLNTEVYTLLEQRHQEALIKEAEKIEEVSIVKPALKPTTPINPPQTTSVTFVGTVLGLILGLVFSFVIETMDTSIGTIEDVEAYLEVPVVGIIPYIGLEEIKDILLKKSHIEQSDEILERNARLVTQFAPKSTLAESYRALRTNIQFSCLEQDAKLILFTSSSPGEGKSSTVMNLAMVMAQAGSKTLLIDADLRKPMINKVFGIDREPGISDVILGNYEWGEVIRTVTDVMMGKMGMEDIIATPGVDNLNIMTSGTVPPNPSELLNSPRVPALLAQMKEKYDIILIDTTPILPATDAAILGSKVDGVVIVYQVGKIARGALKRAKVQMDNVKAKVIGIVLNGLKPEVSLDYHDYRYESYYAYGADYKEPKKKKWIEMPDFIKKIMPKRSDKTLRVPKEQGKESNIFTGALKILTLIMAVSLMFLGIFYEVDYEKEREKGIPIVSLSGTPPSPSVKGGVPEISGGPGTGTKNSGDERGVNLFSRQNIFISVIIAVIMTMVGLISVIAVRKRYVIGNKRPQEGVEDISEKEKIEVEKEMIETVEGGLREGQVMSPVKEMQIPELNIAAEDQEEERVPELLVEKETIKTVDTAEDLFKEFIFEEPPSEVKISETVVTEKPEPELLPELNLETGMQVVEGGGIEIKDAQVDMFMETTIGKTVSEVELGVKEIPEPELFPGLNLETETPVIEKAGIGVKETKRDIFRETFLEEPVSDVELVEKGRGKEGKSGQEAKIEELTGKAYDVEEILEGEIIEEETEEIKGHGLSEAESVHAQSGASGNSEGTKETLIDSSFKGFETEEEVSAVEEEPVDFMELEKGDIFENIEEKNEENGNKQLEEGLEQNNAVVGEDLVTEPLPKEGDFKQEVTDTQANPVGDMREEKYHGIEVVHEDEWSHKRDKNKSSDEQIREWERLLLLD